MILYRDIMKARLSGDKARLNESSLSRIWGYVQRSKKKSMAIMSAFRRYDENGDHVSRSENEKRSKRLMSELRSAGHGPTKLIGTWNECTLSGVDYKDCPKDKLEITKEISFAVVGISKDDAYKLCKKYDQDAVIYLGPETKGKAALLWKNGTVDILGDYSPGIIRQGFSRVRGRPFTFEGFDLRPESWVDAMTEMLYMGGKVRETVRLVLML